MDQLLEKYCTCGIKPPKNSAVASPHTNSLAFATVPEISRDDLQLPNGQVSLRYGRHFGNHSGFGILHIWEQHQAALTSAGYPTIHDVARYVSEIVRPRADITCEFSDMRGDHKIAVVRSNAGTAILKPIRSDQESTLYSIVTAFDRRTREGTLVGRLT